MSIKVSVLGSGSRGNATYVRTDKTRVLIDCGLSRRAIGKRLSAIGEDPEAIDAVLITHEHADHIGGLRVMLKKSSIEAYMSEGTMEGGRTDRFEKNGSAIVPISPGSNFRVGDLEVIPFSVPHDAEQPVAFSIRYNGIKVTQLTDVGWIPDAVAEALSGSDILILESNHDLDMLRVGPYPWSLKERLMGRKGHLSNSAVGRFLRGPYDGDATHIILAHLSSKNNHPELAKQEAQRALASRGLERTSLSLAVQDSPSTPLELG